MLCLDRHSLLFLIRFRRWYVQTCVLNSVVDSLKLSLSRIKLENSRYRYGNHDDNKIKKSG